jgi:hypothetical protein
MNIMPSNNDDLLFSNEDLLDEDFDKESPRIEVQPAHYAAGTIDPLTFNILQDLLLIRSIANSRSLRDKLARNGDDLPHALLVLVFKRYVVHRDNPDHLARVRIRNFVERGYLLTTDIASGVKGGIYRLTTKAFKDFVVRENPKTDVVSRKVSALTRVEVVRLVGLMFNDQLTDYQPRRVSAFTFRMILDWRTAESVVRGPLNDAECVAIIMRYPRFTTKHKARRYRTKLVSDYKLVEKMKQDDIYFWRFAEEGPFDVIADRHGAGNWQDTCALTRELAIALLRHKRLGSDRIVRAPVQSSELKDYARECNRMMRGRDIHDPVHRLLRDVSNLLRRIKESGIDNSDE